MAGWQVFYQLCLENVVSLAHELTRTAFEVDLEALAFGATVFVKDVNDSFVECVFGYYVGFWKF